MVNVTYDACQSVPVFSGSLATIDVLCFNPAGSLNWVDPSGATVVYNPGDIAWVLASTALVWIMVPGVGFFYSGLMRCARDNVARSLWA